MPKRRNDNTLNQEVALNSTFSSDEFEQENDSHSNHSTKSIIKEWDKNNYSRFTTSCENCIAKKLKCDKAIVYAQCRMRNLYCIWDRGIPSKAVEPVHNQTELELYQAHVEIKRLKETITGLGSKSLEKELNSISTAWANSQPFQSTGLSNKLLSALLMEPFGPLESDQSNQNFPNPALSTPR